MKTQEKKIGGSTILLGEHKFNYSNIPGGRGKIFPGFWKGNMIAPYEGTDQWIWPGFFFVDERWENPNLSRWRIQTLAENPNLSGWSSGYICIYYIYIIKYRCVCVPGTQMGPFVLNGKGLVLGGLTFKNRGHLGSKYTYMSCLIFWWWRSEKLKEFLVWAQNGLSKNP